MPPLDPTVATNIVDATSYIYTGANPVQKGVAANAIDPRRLTVIRGKVLDREGSSLPGVTVGVHNHGELGTTVSQVDGTFVIVVNGGGAITVTYSKAGLLSAHRQLSTSWHEYAHLPDVVLIPVDPKVTRIDLNAMAPHQIARGSVVADGDGSRQATLLISPGTTATGGGIPLSSLHIRATEYTVGPNGPKAMPASLPPSSGYTYAVELSADEALGQEVQFSQPVFTYLENYLGFPAGTVVPAGYYDQNKGTWMPSESGRVVKLLEVAQGLAVLDTDGDGAADSEAAQAGLGVTVGERQQLGTLYAAGQTLWRIPITHFSPWDFNWGFGPPEDAEPPEMPAPGVEPLVEDPVCRAGSVIECENQSLGEAIPIVGTPFSLHYRSDRAPGRAAARTIDIGISGAKVSPSLKSIEVHVAIAGQKHVKTFSGSPNQRFRFTWDGRDWNHRPVSGSALAIVRIGYVYGGVYKATSRFGYSGNAAVVFDGRFAQRELVLWQEHRVFLGTLAGPLAGWSLSPHHAYAPTSRVFYRGDGQTPRPPKPNLVSAVVKTVAGSGPQGFSGDDGPATQAQLSAPRGVAVAADGTVYLKDSGNHRIRKISPEGVITTVAGTGVAGSAGDGGPATAAKIYLLHEGIDVAPDGSVIFVDANRIRRIGPDGIITTIAGTGVPGFGGDGGLATLAQLQNARGVAVDSDGSVFFCDTGNSRVRRVDTAGVISTFAGIGVNGFTGDDGPATNARLGLPTAVAVGKDGSVYIAGDNRIRRVSPDGIITSVGGTGAFGPGTGDGGPASQAQIGLFGGIEVDRDNTIYISDRNYGPVRAIGPDGTIRAVAGAPPSAFVEGALATQTHLGNAYDLSLAPDGRLYVVDQASMRLRRIESANPALSFGEVALASEDGTELYVMSGNGRHLRTLHALSGTVRYAFGYDPSGRITSVKDGDGNVTSIEWDPTKATPVAIVAPHGQRTELEVDASGFLASVKNPANETHRMTNDQSGLLTMFTDPRGNSSTMTYDPDGRLIKDENAAKGSWTLALARKPNGHSVDMTSAEGRKLAHSVDNLSTGAQSRTSIAADGTKSSTLIAIDGTRTVTAADGTVVATSEGADPRFGMQAPFTKSITVKLPSGITMAGTAERTVSLTKPADLFSLTTATERVTVNGKTFTSAYDAAQKQFTLTSPLGRQRIVKVDAQGRVVEVKIAEVEAVSYGYDSRGRLISISQGSGAAARATDVSYNDQGFLGEVTYPLDRRLSFNRDAAGRVTKQTQPGNRVITFGYNTKGNVTSLTPPGRPSHDFSYTPVDLREQYRPPAIGQPMPETSYSYNRDKDLTRITWPDGQVISLAHDTGGRLNMLITPAGSTTYAYSATSGRLITITAPGATLGYSYDGALPLSETWGGAIAGAVTRTYNNDLLLSGLGVNGTSVSYAYDNDGLLSKAGDLTLARNAANGLLVETTLGATATTQKHDAFGALSNLVATQAGVALLDIQYTRDIAGRITQQAELVSGQANTSVYSYDEAGRLTGVVKNGVSATYSYDANGNRLGHNGATGTYDDQDRLLTYGSNSYTYGANGELKTKTGNSQTTLYAYDVRGNLTSVTLPNGMSIDYIIDERDRRIGKKVNGVIVQSFLYQGSLRPVAEFDGTGALLSRFVYATRVNVPDYVIRRGVTYRILTDHLGSPRLVVDTTTGQVIQRMDYDTFGNVLADSALGFQPFGFAGGMYDSHTKLVRFGARDYDSETGRWTAKDRSRFRGGDTNLYGYCFNDPINWIDPRGRAAIAIPIGFGIGTGLGAGGGAAVAGGGAAVAIPGIGVAFAVGFAIGTGINYFVGDHIQKGLDWTFEDDPSPPVVFSLPRGFLPGDKGAKEWGRRDGCGAQEGKRRFHQGVKGGDNMSEALDKYGVDPRTGDVVDPEGEIIGNLNDE